MLFLWAFYASCTIMLLPIWQGRTSIRLFLTFATQGKKGLDKALDKTAPIVEGVNGKVPDVETLKVSK